MKNQLRNRLLIAFLVATLVPLTVSIWLISSLLDQSLAISTTDELDELSVALEETGRQYYQEARERLREEAESGARVPEKFALAAREAWPPAVAAFWESGDRERFATVGPGGSTLEYLSRRDDGVDLYQRPLGVRMDDLSELYGLTRTKVASIEDRDLRRGFQYTLLLVAVSVGTVAVLLLVFFARRISRPVQRLTTALQALASGKDDIRVEVSGSDEISEALAAFNRMAEQLRQSRERLVELTRLESWQAIGRKMAHEVKNSLTPIRLTAEEMAARHAERLPPPERAFVEKAAQIITEEVNRLERRVAAFSSLAAEPPVRLESVDVNEVIEERVEFQRASHPGVRFRTRFSADIGHARADEDLLRVIVTNLIENAAEAAGAEGEVLATTSAVEGGLRVEIHDSGPGLSEQARATLFQPTVSFKKSGMGLGLSIAHKSAMLMNGAIALVEGELGGAGFRLTLPVDHPGTTSDSNPNTEQAWAQSES